MAYNENSGIVDLFFGRSDIENKIIRTVGDPYKRFSEDALRILRALRFASSLSFAVEEKTAEAVFALSDTLSDVSSERIFAEWKKLASGRGAYSVITRFNSVISKILSLERVVLCREEAFNSLSPALREIGIFALSSPSPAADFRAAMLALRADSQRIKEGVAILENLGEPVRSEIEIKLLLSRLTPTLVNRLISLKTALGLCDTAALSLLDSVINSGEAYNLKMLKISGTELLSLGLSGEKVGHALSTLLYSVIYGRVKNEREALLAYLKSDIL
jgi:tRNA nucleotidyltransferase (CCA-adding enzyme)